MWRRREDEKEEENSYTGCTTPRKSGHASSQRGLRSQAAHTFSPPQTNPNHHNSRSPPAGARQNPSSLPSDLVTIPRIPSGKGGKSLRQSRWVAGCKSPSQHWESVCSLAAATCTQLPSSPGLLLAGAPKHPKPQGLQGVQLQNQLSLAPIAPVTPPRTDLPQPDPQELLPLTPPEVSRLSS